MNNLEKMKVILSLPKSIYFNFRTLKFKEAIRLPIIISYNTKLGKISKNVIHLNNWNKKHYRIFFGIGGSKHIIPNKYSRLDFGKNASITFNGKGRFAEGCSFRCDYGKISFGENISVNRNCCFNCEYEMSFGDAVLFGWNINVRDTDGHDIFIDGIKKENQKSVVVGNHVWICSYSDILKGSIIRDDSVVAWRSLVLKSFDKGNVLIGGTPATIIKDNLEWKF